MYSLIMAETPTMPPFGGEPNDPIEMMNRIAMRRDRGALALLFSQLAPRVKSMMLKLGTSEALAEDLVQETFLTVWRKAHLYSPQRGVPSTWIFTIARNLRIDQVRRQSSKPHADIDAIDLEGEAPVGTAALEQQQVIVRVTQALRSLPAEQREVVHLSFIGDLTHAEIAHKTGIPLGTVKSRLRLAYERLRPLLEDLQ